MTLKILAIIVKTTLRWRDKTTCQINWDSNIPAMVRKDLFSFFPAK